VLALLAGLVTPLAGSSRHTTIELTLAGHVGVTLSRFKPLSTRVRRPTFTPAALRDRQEHPEAFEQLQRNGMGRNSSWDQAASQYEQIFDWAMVRRSSRSALNMEPESGTNP